MSEDFRARAAPPLPRPKPDRIGDTVQVFLGVA